MTNHEHRVAGFIAQSTGASNEEIKHVLKVKRATQEIWVTISTPVKLYLRHGIGRAHGIRGTPHKTRELVKIVTLGDHKVCEICARAEKNNPYTAEEIEGLRVSGYDGSNGLIHHNCRCVLGEWFGDRPMPATYGRGGERGGMPPDLLDARKIGSRIAEEIKVMIKRKN